MPDDLGQGLRLLLVEGEGRVVEELRQLLARRGAAEARIDGGEDETVLPWEATEPQLLLLDARLAGDLDLQQVALEVRRKLAAPVALLTYGSEEGPSLAGDPSVTSVGGAGPCRGPKPLVALGLSPHRHDLEAGRRRRMRCSLTVLSSVGDGVFLTDSLGRVEFMNLEAEKLTGRTLEEARGRRIDEVFPVVSEVVAGASDNPLLGILQGQEIVELLHPSEMIASDQERIPIEATAASIRDEAGDLEGIVVAFRDDTHRRTAREALQKAEDQVRQMEKLEAIGRLAGGIAHDFNNLLTVINGCSELLLDSEGPDGESRSLLLQIRKAGDRAAGMTRQLLAFSRKQVLRPIPLDLGELVADVSGLLERLIGEDIALEPAFAPGLARIQADPSQLEQVLLNLAVNARDAMPKGGRLRIATSNVNVSAEEVEDRPEIEEGPYVLLEVSDTGIGMSEEIRRRAFEPYFTTKTPDKGTGVGLATVYGVVKQSRGFLELDSEVGRGTTFRLYFPALASIPLEVRAEGEGVPAVTGGWETILLVEDDHAVRSLVARSLASRGYRVLDAASGEEALRVFDEHAREIQVLVTDVVMPGMNGRELSETLRALKPSVKVLFLSGYNDDPALRASIHGGDAAFLQKPFRPTTLTRKVRELLDE